MEGGELFFPLLRTVATGLITGYQYEQEGGEGKLRAERKLNEVQAVAVQ